ncbi:AraC family transcriptional regulator [uncultured Bilophila sp.]|uniref:helix-turn-helix transcriptional regulator n=1 Tax=uncultured Bilophila sp. TaxID=529385 RepID=UPI00280B6C04|nr:AraC family transcriptional regulator [uncultured Bilophila sp.]
MLKETRTIHYDAELAVEAYWLQNVLEPFPSHFHDYYLIGFIEKGSRELVCGGQRYVTLEGDLFTLNPHEPHGCRSYDGKPFSYRGIGVLPDVMRAAMREITGQAMLPQFRERILSQSELACSLRDLHAMIVQEDKEFRKEEIFLMLLGQLLRDNAGETPLPDAYKDESGIGAVCAYLEEHSAEPVSLERLGEIAGLSKYYLLRSFTKQKGISPYRYLETIRIAKARKLLERNVPLIEAALQTGFADQSHFSRFFKRLIGVTPRQYAEIFGGRQA